MITRAQFVKLDTEGLIAYLAANEVVLPPDVQQIFRTQMIDGDGLTGMTLENLKAEGIPSGIASKILKRIPHDDSQLSSCCLSTIFRLPIVFLLSGFFSFFLGLPSNMT